MAEYIEREALLDRVYAVRDKLQLDLNNPFEDGVRIGFENVEIEIENYPAADVRPVVLCKDCKHYEQLDLFRNSPAWSGMCHYWNSHATREDGFCFKAAKKEET